MPVAAIRFVRSSPVTLASLRLTALVSFATFSAAPVVAQSRPTLPSSTEQIMAAVSPLPEPMRAGATVLGYLKAGTLESLRQGTNGMRCLADDPSDDRFHVACYHDSLEPFMARGRELRAQGVVGDKVDSVRYADVASGRIRMPATAALYSLTGPKDDYDVAKNAAPNSRPLFVIYVPGATTASTGLSAIPVAGKPWLMLPGTPKAHIMLTPSM